MNHFKRYIPPLLKIEKSLHPDSPRLKRLMDRKTVTYTAISRHF